jgi:hypothetical protein
MSCVCVSASVCVCVRARMRLWGRVWVWVCKQAAPPPQSVIAPPRILGSLCMRCLMLVV